jgi:AraC-like DNA-binding protein
VLRQFAILEAHDIRHDPVHRQADPAKSAVKQIAHETGFGDRERMRRSFLRTFGQTPQNIRNASHPLATI